MPYHDTWGFTPPDDAVIWRYMDLPRLVYLLERRALFFSRVDKLEDRLEGSLPRGAIELRRQHYEAQFGERAPDYVQSMAGMFEERRRFACVNCWHQSQVESMAMWKLYGRVPEAVAIRSTVGRLKSAIAAAPEKLYIERVTYIDFATAKTPYDNTVLPFLIKDVSFAYESEVRAFYRLQPKPGDTQEDWEKVKGVPGNGLPIDTDPNALIEALYVSPAAGDWFASSVQTVVRALGYAGEILQSRLAAPPLY